MFPSIVRLAKQDTPYIYRNLYRAKRLWPPDFKKLTTKEQFRLERRYKRRVKLKWARPGWTKAVKLAQLGSIVFVTVYGVLFLDWRQEIQPFQGIRNWFWQMTESMWTNNPSRFDRRDGSVDTSSKAGT